MKHKDTKTRRLTKKKQNLCTSVPQYLCIFVLNNSPEFVEFVVILVRFLKIFVNKRGWDC